MFAVLRCLFGILALFVWFVYLVCLIGLMDFITLELFLLEIQVLNHLINDGWKQDGQETCHRRSRLVGSRSMMREGTS